MWRVAARAVATRLVHLHSVQALDDAQKQAEGRQQAAILRRKASLQQLFDKIRIRNAARESLASLPQPGRLCARQGLSHPLHCSNSTHSGVAAAGEAKSKAEQAQQAAANATSTKAGGKGPVRPLTEWSEDDDDLPTKHPGATADDEYVQWADVMVGEAVSFIFFHAWSPRQPKQASHHLSL